MNWEQFKQDITELERGLVETYKDILVEINPTSILEVGSGWGLFGRTALEWTKAKLTTIDKIPGYGREDFNRHTAGLENRIERIIGDSKEVLPKLIAEGRKFDFVFVDADHGMTMPAVDMRNAWNMTPVLMLDDVFHKENWVVDAIRGCTDEQAGKNARQNKFNYGVTQALWGFIRNNKLEAYIYPVGSGGWL